MNRRYALLAVLVCALSYSAAAQAASQQVSPNAAFYPTDPMVSLVGEVTKISTSVTSLTKQMKLFVDKFEKVGEITFDDKQKKLILAMELLGRAEARVATLQRLQIDMTEKLNENRTKLAQVEVDLKPSSIERSVALVGTTQADELRDNRRVRLTAERSTLSQLVQQLQTNLAETTDGLRDAQSLVVRLRKLYLPQIERELFENQ